MIGVESRNLIIIVGQEGVGKSTIAKKIVKYLKNGASFDAENILQVNPFEFNDHFLQLAKSNSAVLINNFFKHGYETVVAGSFIDNLDGYKLFLPLIEKEVKVYIVNFLASRKVRDKRRIEREKPTTEEWRDLVDSLCPPDTSLRDGVANNNYTYFEIDNSELTIEETLESIVNKFPELFVELTDKI